MSRRGKMSTRGRSEIDVQKLIPSGMSKEEVEELQKAFELFDLEDGVVPIEDMLEEMKKTGLESRFPAAVALLKETDSAGEGTLSFPELLELMALDVRSASEDSQLTKLFRLLDIEGEGFLNSEQVRAMFSEIGEDFSDEDWPKQFARLDEDQDGKFSYEDFLNSVGKGVEDEA